MSDHKKAIVRKLIEEVQVGGNYAVFDALMHPDFIDHTPTPGFSSDRDSVRSFYRAFHASFSEPVCKIDFQTAEGDLVTTRKVYSVTHSGPFNGIPPTGRRITFDVIDVLKVEGEFITAHWGILNLMKIVAQIS
ncbi:ester cyclase [Agrobacterium vitis]|uniref:ester cyclase n=1 Tax=Agrobacterium vitis TaxID=373 RepID=UPI0008724343|nr:ester cyclase [Agrobacterium vitis]MCE6074067.1 ester cyclase [Agrobacterium vitis]MCF1454250.1 ester cyclase [Agrobacterium vitis]MCF1466600.1 ester cyclase [Agrobacterium vitis]MCM2450399.1 ester cyclase [Agrobacterium vitis]MCM2468898.1 ester cyclase [Agrobacterium vitis]